VSRKPGDIKRGTAKKRMSCNDSSAPGRVEKKSGGESMFRERGKSQSGLGHRNV